MTRTRIVIVDDHAMVASAFARLLEQSKHLAVVAVAGTAQEGLTLCTDGKIAADVVLVDLGLTDHDGLWLVARLRDVAPDLATIVVTAHRDASTVRAAFAAGADGFVSKSEAASSLRDAVDAATAGRMYLSASCRTPPLPLRRSASSG